jgi:sporulation protein YlmC with PRC-barrel domain
MLKMHFAAGLAATALMTAAAIAQTSPGASSQPAPTAQSGGSGGAAAQLMAQMPPDMIRGSKLMGVDVYGSDNQKIGDIDEVIVDKQGKIHAVVVGVGGFLGIGTKDVAIPYDQVQWMSSQEVQAQGGQGGAGSGTNTAGGVTTPGSTTSAGTDRPATTGSTGGAGGAAGSGAGSASGSDTTTPARATIKMTKADLQNAPEFRYSADTGRSGTGGGAPRQ